MILNKKTIYFSLLTLLAISLILGIIILALKKNDQLTVSFLNVGQGDAILIANGNQQVLIDAGRNGKIVLEKLGQVMPFWDRKIEALIITHPDADHYGGVAEIVDSYKIENIIKTTAINNSGEWMNLMEKIKNRQINNLTASWGSTLVFPAGAKLQIIYPFTNVPSELKDKNDTSVVTKLVFGENEFIFTGDLSEAGEEDLLNSNLDLQADFLKIGHHGSKSSSSSEFLNKVKPQDAIISVGKSNSYGHPHKEVTDDLKNRLIRIWRTDQDGNVSYNCKNSQNICQPMGQ